MEKILLFQVKDSAAIKAIAGPMHIRVEEIETSAYRETLNDLYRGKMALAESYTGDVPQGSLMVFCNLEDKTLDKVLAAMKKKKIAVTYKAVMTPTNAKWNILRIYFEMEQERRAYEASRL